MARIATDPNYSSPTFPRATAGTDLFVKEDVQALAAAVSTHDHSSGKGLALTAGAIPNDIITSAMILDGTIATADVAAHAITQGYQAVGVASGPTTTSPTFVDIPDLSVAVTAAASADLIVMLTVTSANTTIGALNTVALSLDAAAEVGNTLVQSPAANGFSTSVSIARFTGVASGAHTVKARWNCNTGTLSSPGQQRYLVVLEVRR